MDGGGRCSIQPPNVSSQAAHVVHFNSASYTRASSPASALPQPASKTRPWPKTSPPSGILPIPGCPLSGEPARGWYVVDKGFAGQRRRDCYGAWVIRPPKRNSRNPRPKELRRWLAGMRQMVETVFDKLHHAFRLAWERPHQLECFQTRVAAKRAFYSLVAVLTGKAENSSGKSSRSSSVCVVSKLPFSTSNMDIQTCE